MKSKTWFFNLGVCKNLLRRCWPLWAAYLLLAMLMLPAEVANRIENINIVTQNGNRYVLNAGIDLATIAVFVGIVAAMTMFSYLYSAKGSGMMCSLPLRRETVFLTAYITGIVPILLIDVLAVGTTWLVCLGTGTVRNLVFAQTLGLMLTANIAFYNFAVLCAVLTGSIIVLPAVYFVLNAAVYVAENVIRTVLSYMVYGMGYNGSDLMFLSPMMMVFNRLGISSLNTWDYTISCMKYLLIFMAVSILFVALAVFILRRRHMESATDVVAVPVLKPIFKYCLSVGCAFVFCCAVFESFFRDKLSGMPEALLIIALLVVGSFIGYFVAEMLMQKTVRVFGNMKKFRAWGICCVALAVFILCFEFDAFGFETFIPEADKIENVRIEDCVLDNEENILLAQALHSQIIKNKSFNENSQQTQFLMMTYNLKNGRSVFRQYNVAWDWDTINDESSDACTLQKLINVQEAIEDRSEMRIPLSRDTVTSFRVLNHWVSEKDGVSNYEEINLKLSPEQAEDFYLNYLLPDIKDGKMGRRWKVQNKEYYNTVANVRFDIELSNRALLANPADDYAVNHSYYNFNLNLDAERCLKWIEENTDIVVLPLAQAESHYKDFAYDIPVQEVATVAIISK